MKIKTSDLTGPALDWAVASSDGRRRDVRTFQAGYFDYGMYHYSTSWAQGGPLIEREGISTMFHDQGHWTAANLKGTVSAEGPTPLIAAMRCYCCSKLGDVVDVPEELCQAQNS